ncbi:type I-A CRISPR-associated protein Csa5, partial [Caldisericum sp.]|uniref:type I-A CRISPR-associated protein Csa5 n=1 Tax=Caldisericum sp. TaxID=2499687 RepID=UPI003D0C3166
MITLYTPATGFPDLEAKIAYGLARVGIEAGCDFYIVPQQGFYQIKFDKFSSHKFKQSFLMILERLLSSNRFFDLGVKAKDKGKYSANEDIIKQIQTLFIQNNHTLENFYQLNNLADFNFKKHTFCGHRGVNKFGGSSGLILISSFHAGKPYFRDKIYDKFNMNLCEICGYLAVLGFNSFAFIVQMGTGKNKKYVLVLPVPKKEISKENLIKLLSLQKTSHNFWLSDLQPLTTFSIGLLAKVPSLCDIINELQLLFHLTLLSKDNRGDTVVEQTAVVGAINFSKFISNSAYNSATVEKLVGSYNEKPKISSMIELTNALENLNKDSLLKFARLYVQETSTDNWVNLLYPETVKYLLREVAMISSEIIENSALGSLARTLRYFIRERKYSYADDIRNARKESKDFEETIAKMLREG